MFYDEKRSELKSIVDFVEKKVDAVRGKLLRKYIENYTRDISDRMREKLVDAEPEYIGMHEIYLEAKEVYDKYVSIMDAFKLRGFALRDVTALRINKLETGTL